MHLTPAFYVEKYPDTIGYVKTIGKGWCLEFNGTREHTQFSEEVRMVNPGI